jgi:hypothetical protein
MSKPVRRGELALVVVNPCPRCGGEHNGVEVRRFENAVADQEDVLQYDRWATCPDTGDPILWLFDSLVVRQAH